MLDIIVILQALNKPQASLLIYSGVMGPRYVNDKIGPNITKNIFNILLKQGYIKPLCRVQKLTDGPWYSISEKGKLFCDI